MAIDRAGLRATRFAKITVDAIWWLGLGISAVLVVVFVAAPLLDGSGLVARFDWRGFQVAEGHGPPGVALQVSMANDERARVRPLSSADPARASEPSLEPDGRGRLEFQTERWGFFYGVNALLLPLVGAMLLGIHLLRSFLTDVLAADVFTPLNASRLSRLGWLLIVVGIAGPRLEYWRAWLILKRIDVSGAVLSPASAGGSGLELVGVLVLVLASAWRYGAELQQERDLTV